MDSTIKELAAPEVQYKLIFLLMTVFFILKHFLVLFLNRFWKKTVETEYVTAQQCEKYRIAMNTLQQKNEDTLHETLQGMSHNIEILTGFFVSYILDNKDLSNQEKKDAVMILTNKGN